MITAFTDTDIHAAADRVRGPLQHQLRGLLAAGTFEVAQVADTLRALHASRTARTSAVQAFAGQLRARGAMDGLIEAFCEQATPAAEKPVS